MVSLSLSLVALLAAAQAQSPTPEPPPAKGQEAGKGAGTESAAPKTPAPPIPTPAAGAPVPGQGDEISLDEWDRADWQLVKPKTSLVELDGYFRLRGDMLRRINFGNGSVTEWAAGAPAPRYVPSSNGDANFTGTNMRLRVEPTINVTEDIHLVTTFDVLDNVVLGSSADTRYTQNIDGQPEPVNVVDPGQAPAERGINSIEDAIVVRRLYARVTALNEQLELRFGRMPSEWGLGMLSNAGNCLDCDFGDVVDRLALTFKLADMVFTPMYDWVSSGPSYNPYYHSGISASGYDATGRSGGQPLDAVDWDDVEQYSLRIQKLEGAEAVRERVAAGQTVFNYGVWGIWRRQARDLSTDYYTETLPNGTQPNTPAQYDPATGTVPDSRRDSNIFTGDAYAKLYVGKLELGVEAAAIYGTLHVSEATAEGIVPQSVDLWQLGGALEAIYRFDGDAGTALSLKAGAASGDSSPGFGAIDRTTSQFGNQVATEGWDGKLNNFQFSPDYHVDLLLFRQIIGTVTDAWYVRPQISYAFGNNIGGKFAAVYSQAMSRRSTYSGMFRRSLGNGAYEGTEGSLPLGLEFDGELSYGLLSTTRGGAFKAALAGGLLFPLSGFAAPAEMGDVGGKSFAWTLQSRLYVTF